MKCVHGGRRHFRALLESGKKKLITHVKQAEAEVAGVSRAAFCVGGHIIRSFGKVGHIHVALRAPCMSILRIEPIS